MPAQKKLFWISNIVLILLMIGMFLYVKTSTKKVGYLDFGLLLSKYEGFISGKELLNRNTQVYRNNMDTLNAEFTRAVKKFETEQKGMTLSEKKLRKQELERQKEDLLRYREAVSAKIQEEEEKTIDEFSKEIRDYLDQYSRENNYTVVFFHKNELIAYAEKENDITNEVLEGLNKQYRKGRR